MPNKISWLQPNNPPPKKIASVIIGLAVLSTSATYIGDAFLSVLHPAALIALNPRGRYLALATNQLDALTFYSIGGARLLSSDPLYFLIGLWYGDKCISWIETRSRTYGPLIRDSQRMFYKLAYPLIFLFPNPYICVLSGTSGIAASRFAVVNLAGTAFSLYTIRYLGATFSHQLGWINDFIGKYRWQILAVTVTLVLWSVLSEYRSGDSQLTTLKKLAEHSDQDD